MDTCKYVHYQIDYPANHSSKTKSENSLVKKSAAEGSTILYPPQVCLSSFAFNIATASEISFHKFAGMVHCALSLLVGHQEGYLACIKHYSSKISFDTIEQLSADSCERGKCALKQLCVYD